MELRDLYRPDPREPYREDPVEQLPTVYVDDIENTATIPIATMFVIAVVVVVIGTSILLAVGELLAPLMWRAV